MEKVKHFASVLKENGCLFQCGTASAERATAEVPSV